MSRRGGKRKEVVQLTSNSSKLHRYGYSKQLHSGELPKLIGDYPNSDSEEGEDEEPLPKTQELLQADDVAGLVTMDPTTGKLTEPDKGPADMDDELRNFLSEIEAIPMPPENGHSQATTSGTKDPVSQNKEEPKPVCEEGRESPSTDPPVTATAAKPKQYSMFVRGGTEFAHSPVQQSEVVEEETKEKVGLPALEELPEEPVSQWQMVQDETTQYYYYWNYVTNEVTWDIPTEYTQYLLLHKEYSDRLAKYTPEQLELLQERKASKSQGVVSSQLNSGQAQLGGHVEEKPYANSKVSTELSEETARERHERKKKKKKKHKRKYSDDDSADDERSSRKSQSSRKQEMGPAPKPQSPKASVSLPSGGLFSIGAYDSDQDESEKEEEASQQSTKELPFSNGTKRAESEERSVKSEPSELVMPDLSAPVSPAPLGPDTMPNLSPAVPPDLTDSAATGATPLVEGSLSSSSLKGEELATNKGDVGDSEPRDLGDEMLCPPTLTDSNDKILSTEMAPSLTDGGDSSDIATAKSPTNCVKDCADTPPLTQESKDFSDSGTTKQPLAKKNAEVIDMFADDFPSVEEVVKPSPVLQTTDPSDADVPAQCDGVPLTQTEVELSKDLVHGQSVPRDKEPDHTDRLPLVKSVESLDVPQPKVETGKTALQGIVASYSGSEEEEEGEVREKSKEKLKKKKKDKKKESKRKHTDEIKERSPKRKQTDEAKDKSPKRKRVDDTKEKSPKPSKTKTATDQLRKTADPSPLEAGSVEGQGSKAKIEPAVSTSVEDTSVDIDPEDLDDIDRALEQALERKLERKMVELDSYTKVEGSKENSPAMPLKTEPVLSNGQDSLGEEQSQKDENAALPDTSEESETLKVEVNAMAELALNKLEFLDISTENLSRLQLLFIELQTRQSDWQAGGLSTEYFLQQLRVAEGLLEQYETSAVPEGWACQWDRANNRYYYRNLSTDRIQWEYPETGRSRGSSERPGEDNQDQSREASDEEKKSRSSSSRHRKREEKDRGKHDKRGSSRRHRRKRHRRRDPSSSSQGSEEEASSRHQSSRHHHKSSKKKKRRRSEARSPSVEVLGKEEAPGQREVVEIVDEDKESRTSSPSVLIADTDQPSPGPSDKTAPGTGGAEAETSTGAAASAQGGAEEDVDGEAMEEEEEDQMEETKEDTEEVNAAIISKPPQIFRPPEIAVVQPPQLYTAPAEQATESAVASTTSTTTTTSTPSTTATSTTEVKPSEQAPVDAEAEKQAKKKKKDKKSSASSLMLKKKQMSSMVQKWQRVKKEVEKEDRAKELRQAAIRQKISQLK